MDKDLSARKVWIDVAKGACMVLVVLRHVTLWIENEFNDGPLTPWWQFSEFLGPIRMPLFFLISGYLVANAIRRPLAQARARTFGFIYIYIIWTALFLLRLWIPTPGPGHDPPLWQHFLVALLLPTVFWYIWALALYFLICWGCQRIFGPSSKWLAIPFFALSFTAPALNDIFIPLLPGPIDALKFGSIVQNFVWFYAGAHGRDLLDQIMKRATWRSMSMWAAAYAAAYILALAAELRTPLLPALALLALIATAQAIPLIRAPRSMVRGLEAIGSLTLPVYIFHTFGISAISLIVKALGWGSIITDTISVSAFVIPPLLTVPLIWICMLVGRVILQSPARWLLSPDWLRARPVRTQVS